MPNRIRYYTDRLKNMSRDELLDRIRRRFAVAYERLQIATGKSGWTTFRLADHILWHKTVPDASDPAQASLLHGTYREKVSASELQRRLWQNFKTDGTKVFYFTWKDRAELIKRYNQMYPNRVLTVKKAADELCDHIIPIFGQRFSFEENIPWQHDPVTKRQWPLQYSPRIDFRDGTTVGGIKWVWELNRHQHLVTLAKAYFLTQEERYAEEVCTQILHWIKTNPPLFGVNWISALECGIRLMSWMWTLHFMRSSKATTPGFIYEVYGSIHQQTRFIEKHLSTFASANNHLIGEATALSMVGICFPCFRSAQRWLSKGIAVLTNKITGQIHPDGVFAEQSIHYGTYIIDFYVAVLLLLKMVEKAPPAIWYQRLRKAGTFLMYLKDSQGNVPNIGDQDGGQTFVLCEEQGFNAHESILNTLSVIMGRPDFKRSGRSFDEKTFWLTGLGGWKKYQNIRDVSLHLKSRVFRRGGYFILREDKTVLTFDCGSLGDVNHAAHGHADALGIALSGYGKPLLVDPGMPCYNENVQMRNYFRGTAAHNTVVIDGDNQSTIGDVFLWLKEANARITNWSFTDEYEYVEGVHDGYKRLGVMHRRLIVSLKNDNGTGFWVVRDFLVGTGRRHVNQLWHFAPGARVELDPTEGSAIVRTGNVILRLLPMQPFPLKAMSYRGNKHPFLGWFSPVYGTILKSPVLSYQGISNLPLELTILLIATHQTTKDMSTTSDLISMAGNTLNRILTVQTDVYSR